MNLTRRGFLASCLALAAAPAIVRASSLMRVRPIVVAGLAEKSVESMILDLMYRGAPMVDQAVFAAIFSATGGAIAVAPAGVMVANTDGSVRNAEQINFGAHIGEAVDVDRMALVNGGGVVLYSAPLTHRMTLTHNCAASFAVGDIRITVE